MVERVSTFGLGQNMLRSSLLVQSKYAAASSQKASGLVSTTYGGLGAKASSLLSAETASTQLTTWSSNTKTANSRTQAMFSAVDDMIDQLTSLRSTLSAARSSTDKSLDLNKAGKNTLADLAAQMNLRQDGRYLFAGGKTDTAPVDTAKLSVPTVPSSADTAYYTGDSDLASVRVSAEQTISYGVAAGGSAFEKALRAANVVANMTTSPLNETALNEAYDLATQAIDGLIAVQSGLSTTSKRLESALNTQDAALELLDNMATDIKGVDLPTVTVKLSQYETQLQASYSALAKVSSLSLAKYL